MDRGDAEQKAKVDRSVICKAICKAPSLLKNACVDPRKAFSFMSSQIYG